MKCIELIKLFYEEILCNQVVLSLISGFVGAIIASIVTYRATKQAHENNIELEKLKEKETEKAVVLSIVEELNVLNEIYSDQMNDYFKQLELDIDYLNSYYIVTQDFFTVFTNNSDKIGSISNKELRNLIVKIYVYFKRLLEDFNLLKLYLDELENKKAVLNELRAVSWSMKHTYDKIKSLYNLIIAKTNEIYGETND